MNSENKHGVFSRMAAAGKAIVKKVTPTCNAPRNVTEAPLIELDLNEKDPKNHDFFANRRPAGNVFAEKVTCIGNATKNAIEALPVDKREDPNDSFLSKWLAQLDSDGKNLVHHDSFASEWASGNVDRVLRRNAVGAPSIEQLDLDEKDPILGVSFVSLMKEKHKRGLLYIVALAITHTAGGSVVNHFDAQTLNKGLAGYGYPFRDLKALEECTNPVLKVPFQWLEYYECAPDSKVFRFMCSYAELCSKNNNERVFWQHMLYANQTYDLELAARAKEHLGSMYQNGWGVAVDYAKAEQFYEQAANQKDHLGVAASAKNNLGVLYQSQQDARAKQFYEQAANQTCDLKVAVIAKSNLGFIYQDGLGVEVDYVKATQFYEQAANQTSYLDITARAKNNLGIMYQNGLGVAVDYAKAKELYEQAADQAYCLTTAASAKNNLGIMYEKGEGVAVDCTKAEQLYEQAANQTHDLGIVVRAKKNLGLMYQSRQDYAKSERLYEQAADQTYCLRSAAIAKYQLGIMNKQGHGMPVNLMRAQELFEQVEEQKDDLMIAEHARKQLAELETLMNKNG
jgi:TPR repeat protein